MLLYFVQKNHFVYTVQGVSRMVYYATFKVCDFNVKKSISW